MAKNFDSLYKRIWITRGARFQAYNRFLEINNWSVWTMNILSIYIISLSILSLSPPSNYSFLSSKSGSILLVILSILILVINILENSKNYKGKADNMHRCGKELSQLYNQLCLLRDDVLYEDDSNSLVVKISQEYQKIIDKYDENHSKLDVEKFKAVNRNEFGINFPSAILVNLKYFLFTRGIYIVIIVLPILAFISLSSFCFSH